MSTYKCDNCNYATHDKSNFSKHNNSKKHIEKEKQVQHSSHYIHTTLTLPNENKYNCQYCNCNFSSIANLGRHTKSCFKKNQLAVNFEKQELSNKVNELSMKLNDYIKLLDQKDETISILKSEVTHLKSIVNNTGSIIKTSVSTMAYVIKNYDNAPALESIKDYSAIHYEQDNNEFVENLVYEYNNNKLHVYISDFIIKTYKKADPAKQSLWNSDTSRLTYLIREIITNNKVDWRVDKKGIKTTKFIIEPILEYIDQQVRNYVESYKVDHRISAKEAERQMMKLKSGMEIIKSIETKVLSEEILKYITPHFYLIKNDEFIDI